MHARISCCAAIAACWLLPSLCLAGDVLFEDDFDGGLSSKWQIVGLKKEDYRIRDGGLEMRVQPGKLIPETPMLKVDLPFNSSGLVTASVEVTIPDRFTEPGEFAGLYLTDEKGREFAATKKHLDGFMVFSPGNVEFIGKPGEEGDSGQYALKFWPAHDDAGALRIIVRGHYAHFQVGPSPEGKYLNFFFSAIRKQSKQRGFCLTAAGGPEKEAHWVRFDKFRVVSE